MLSWLAIKTERNDASVRRDLEDAFEHRREMRETPKEDNNGRMSQMVSIEGNLQ
jgi:hypothetical protein